MKKIVLLLACVMLLVSCSSDNDMIHRYKDKITVSCTGNIVEQSVEIDGVYNAIKVYDDFNVIVTDEVSQPTIITDEALINHVDLRVEKNELLVIYDCPIHLKGDVSNSTLKLPEMGNVDEVELNGKTIFRCEEPWQASFFDLSLNGVSHAEVDASMVMNEVDLSLSGASEATIECNVNNLDIDIDGTCVLNLSGDANNLEVEMAGDSRIESEMDDEVFKFSANIADMNLSGNSIIYLNCVEQMNVTAGGNSVIYYTGFPKINQKISGTATICRYNANN